MAQQKGKRAVIISDINSDSIEQAIFILKSTVSSPIGNTPKHRAPGKGIVAEAQDIINSYIKNVENASTKSKFNNRKSKLITYISAFLAFGAATVSVIIHFI